MKALLVRPEASTDIQQAAQWYEAERPGLGAAFLIEVDRLFDRLRESPAHFPVIREGVRRALLFRFPYAIFFLWEHETAIVLAVLHTSRHPDTWKKAGRHN